jgi:predicted Zn-dependent protease
VLVYAGERRLADGRAKEAAVWLRRAAREAPEDGSVHLLVARAEDALGDARKATLALERARELLGDAFPDWARDLLDRLSRR